MSPKVYYMQRWIPNDFGLIEPEPPINLYSILDLAHDGKSKKKKKEVWLMNDGLKRLWNGYLLEIWLVFEENIK